MILLVPLIPLFVLIIFIVLYEKRHNSPIFKVDDILIHKKAEPWEPDFIQIVTIGQYNYRCKYLTGYIAGSVLTLEFRVINSLYNKYEGSLENIKWDKLK